MNSKKIIYLALLCSVALCGCENMGGKNIFEKLRWIAAELQKLPADAAKGYAALVGDARYKKQVIENAPDYAPEKTKGFEITKVIPGETEPKPKKKRGGERGWY